jgi:exoribonuclease R
VSTKGLSFKHVDVDGTKFIVLDSDAKVVGQRLARTVIRSRKRLTYIEAQRLIEGKPDEARKHAKTTPEYSDVPTTLSKWSMVMILLVQTV